MKEQVSVGGRGSKELGVPVGAQAQAPQAHGAVF